MVLAHLIAQPMLLAVRARGFCRNDFIDHRNEERFAALGAAEAAGHADERRTAVYTD